MWRQWPTAIDRDKLKGDGGYQEGEGRVCIVPPSWGTRSCACDVIAHCERHNKQWRWGTTTTMALSGCRKVEVEVLTFEHTHKKHTHTHRQLRKHVCIVSLNFFANAKSKPHIRIHTGHKHIQGTHTHTQGTHKAHWHTTHTHTQGLYCGQTMPKCCLQQLFKLGFKTDSDT